MSIPAFGWAIEMGSLHDLLPSDRLLLMYLADQANCRSGECSHTGQPRMRKYTGLAIETIRSGLKRLAGKALIAIEGHPGCFTVYRILREENPIPQQDVPGSKHATPPNGAGVTPPIYHRVTPHTPPNGAGVTPPTQGADPPNSPPQPPQSAAPTLTVPKKEDPKRRASAPEEGKIPDSGEVGKEAQHPEPPVDPGAFQALIRDIANGFKNNYPPRVSGFSRNEQIEVAEDKPTIKPLPLAGAVLAAARAAAGVRVPA